MTMEGCSRRMANPVVLLKSEHSAGPPIPLTRLYVVPGRRGTT